MKDSNSAGVLPAGIVPISSSLGFTSASLTMAATSSATRLITAGGVPAGASMPAHVLPVKPLMPCSMKVGTSGRAAAALAGHADQPNLAGLAGIDQARGGVDEAAGSGRPSGPSMPAPRPCKGCGPCSSASSTSATRCVRCAAEPLPLEPKLTLPGFLRA